MSTKRDFGLLDFTDLHGTRCSVRLNPEQVRKLLPLLKDFIEIDETGQPDGSASEPELREELAALEHDRWSRWMEYLFSRCRSAAHLIMQMGHPDAMIPGALVERWARQMKTPYSELSEEEKKRDLAEADKTLAVVAEVLEGEAPEDLFIVFDGPPSHESGRFVEVETKDDRRVGAGQWAEREDGYWTLGPFRRAPQE